MDHLEIDLTKHFKTYNEETYDIAPDDEQVNMTKEVSDILEKVKTHLRNEHLALFQRSILDPETTAKINRIVQEFIVNKALTVPDRTQEELIAVFRQNSLD